MKRNKTLVMGILVIVLTFIFVPDIFSVDYYYHIKTGLFEAKEGNSVLWTTTCYSGVSGIYRDNPAYTGEKDYGPIPEGVWYITGVTSSRGPLTIVLEAAQRSQLKGRDDDFRIHGDNSYNQASAGCIVMGDRAYREMIAMTYNNGDGAFLYVSAY